MHRHKKGAEMSKELLGFNLAELDEFKRRSDFSSVMGYSQYVKANIKPNMFVRCIQMTVWDDHPTNADHPTNLPIRVPVGTLGHVVSTDGQAVTVKWNFQLPAWKGKRKCIGAMCWVELLTPPCDIFA